MATYTTIEGDTWDTIATSNNVPTSWVLLSNGLDPDADPPPSDPLPGTVVNVPLAPPAASIAPSNACTVDAGPGGLDVVRIRLHDDTPSPLTNVRYSLRYEGGAQDGTSPDGWVTVAFPAEQCATVELSWGAPDDQSDHPYQTVLFSDSMTGADEELTIARLNNLGYNATASLANAMSRFQYDYGIDQSDLGDDGEVPSATKAALDQIFAGEYDASQS